MTESTRRQCMKSRGRKRVIEIRVRELEMVSLRKVNVFLPLQSGRKSRSENKCKRKELLLPCLMISFIDAVNIYMHVHGIPMLLIGRIKLIRRQIFGDRI